MARWEQMMGAEEVDADSDLFRADVSELSVVRVGEGGDHLLIELWKEGAGTRAIARR